MAAEPAAKRARAEFKELSDALLDLSVAQDRDEQLQFAFLHVCECCMTMQLSQAIAEQTVGFVEAAVRKSSAPLDAGTPPDECRAFFRVLCTQPSVRGRALKIVKSLIVKHNDSSDASWELLYTMLDVIRAKHADAAQDVYETMRHY